MQAAETDRPPAHCATNARRSCRRPESILLIVHTADAMTLLLKRTPPGGFWQSVTGSMEWEENSVKDAAVRELKEETGIEAPIEDVFDWNRSFRFPIPRQVQHRYRDTDRTNKENMLSVRLRARLPVALKAQEHTDCQWVPIDEAQHIVWSWSNREALRMVEKSIARP